MKETFNQRKKTKLRMKKGKKGGGRHISLSKLSNKKLNKLAKQGKLKKKDSKKRLLSVIKRRTAAEPTVTDPNYEPEVETNLDDIPIEEADYEFYAGNGRNLDFLSNAEKSRISDYIKPTKKAKKRLRTIEEEYEESLAPRKKEARLKQMLPIKDQHGLKKQTMLVESDEEATSSSDGENEAAVNGDITSDDDTEKEPLPELTVAQLYAQRQTKLSQYKVEIARLAHKIIENPEQNMAKLRELRGMLEISEAEGVVVVKKLVMISLTEVFKDIIPDYRIRQATDKEKQQATSKEVKKLREFEENLLSNYKKFLAYMESLARGKAPKIRIKDQHSSAVRIPRAGIFTLRSVAVKCLCELLVTHPHFTYRTNIITVIIPFTNFKSRQLSLMVCDYVKKIFKQDKNGEVTLEIVRLIGRMIKGKDFDCDPKVLEIFLALKIKEVQREPESVEKPKMPRAERMKTMSRRERKRKKNLESLEKEMEEAAMTENHERVLKVHTQIINVVFLTYFRILKQAEDSILLGPVLEGLAKFAHLINIDFFEDLFTVINNLIDSGVLEVKESLHCIQTAFTILNNHGTALNIDPVRFYRHLYQNLYDLSAGGQEDNIAIAVQCLDMMISKRRRSVPHERILSYIKRIITLTLQLQSHGSLACLATARSFIQAYPKSDILLDSESIGSGIYLPEANDPDHSNAHNTVLWELHTLLRHYHPHVRQFTSNLLTKNETQGQGRSVLMRSSGYQLWADYNPKDMQFNPDLSPKPSKSASKKTSKNVRDYFNNLAEQHNIDSELTDSDIDKVAAFVMAYKSSSEPTIESHNDTVNRKAVKKKTKIHNNHEKT